MNLAYDIYVAAQCSRSVAQSKSLKKKHFLSIQIKNILLIYLYNAMTMMNIIIED